jgi:xanthine dehydrogenase accessory factor
MFDDFFELAHTLTRKGEAFVTATVVRAEKPTSGKPGDKAIITRDGVMHGWIGGSCAQPSVIREARKALLEDKSRLIRLSPDPSAQTPRDGLLDLPMTCFSGGTIEIYIEPHHPRPRLMIIGNLPVAQALAHLGKAMAYQVIAVEPDGGDAMRVADEVLSGLDQVADRVSPLTYVVVATHANFDESALIAALRAHAPYVGLVASPRRSAQVRQALRDSGLSDNDMLALKSPAGLDIQAKRGDEIALSIMAEIVQRRRNAEKLQLELFGDTPTEQVAHPARAVDPSSGIEIEVTADTPTHIHNGVTYYFNCGNCRAKFVKNPDKYLARYSASSK